MEALMHASGFFLMGFHKTPFHKLRFLDTIERLHLRE